MKAINKDFGTVWEVWEIGSDYVILHNEKNDIVKITKSDFKNNYRVEI